MLHDLEIEQAREQQQKYDSDKNSCNHQTELKNVQFTLVIAQFDDAPHAYLQRSNTYGSVLDIRAFTVPRI